MGFWDRLSRRLDELSEELLPDAIRDDVGGAREMVARGDYGAAIATLERALAHKPDHATARYLLGVARLRTGDTVGAIDALARARELRPGFTEALIALGEASLAKGEPDAAIPFLREALAAGGAAEELADAYLALGRAYLASGARAKGLRELRKALAEDPADEEAAATLAEALLDDDKLDPEEARAFLKGTSPPVLAALGRLELRAGRWEAAEKALARALEGMLPPEVRLAALVGLGDVLARRGDRRGAHDALLRALALAPQDASIHLRLARVLAAAASPEAALDAYERAAALGADPAVLSEAFDVAMAAGLAARAAGYLEGGLGPRERALAEAQAELDADPARAIAAARALLEDNAGYAPAEKLLRSALGRELGDGPAGDPYALAQRVHRVAARRFPELAGEALAIVESYDRPLLVTVMGEFSSGKSTFVNAFLGADVAPVGVTPTTATINVVKYGREPGARIVYQDDRTRDVPWEEVPGVLGALDADEARRIRWVEVLYPLETLARVSIVDTPGLNSILPEHEATARRFIAEADAIVWLFTVGQPGKATEREALERIRADGRRVLGVVNKIDQVTPEEAEAVTAHLRAELGELLDDLAPVSARRALAAREAGDAAALAAAGWPRLDAALEERFFHQARTIKRDIARRRLAGVIERARGDARARADSAGARAAALARAANGARADAALFARVTVPEERQRLAERVAETYRGAAREVLELVRPRKSPFGSHRATGADRDYLIGYLDRGLAEALEPMRERTVADLHQAGEAAAAAAPEAAAALRAHVEDAIALVEARAFDRARAYVRGYLRGGRIDDFFGRVLPKVELVTDNVYHALVRDAPDLELELGAPLGRQGEAALRALATRLDALAAAAAAAALEARVVADAADAWHEELA
ncbi:MAG TPA: dynamin family protein [Haliangiales bacterium]|nr:dynamin family protein [Haliangiales bacterium]